MSAAMTIPPVVRAYLRNRHATLEDCLAARRRACAAIRTEFETYAVPVGPEAHSAHSALMIWSQALAVSEQAASACGARP